MIEFKESMWGVVIGGHHFAIWYGTPALFYKRTDAMKFKNDLQPHLDSKCVVKRVAVSVTLEEAKKARGV